MLQRIRGSTQFYCNHNPQEANGLCERTSGWHGRCVYVMQFMKTYCGTYSLILAADSDEKGRSVAETLVYALLILSAVASIISAAANSVAMPNRVAMNNCRTEYCA